MRRLRTVIYLLVMATKITKSQLKAMIQEAVQEQLKTKQNTLKQKREMLKQYMGFGLNEPGTRYVLYVLEALYKHGKMEARELDYRPEMNTPRDLFERMQTAGILDIGDRPYLNYTLTRSGRKLVQALGIG